MPLAPNCPDAVRSHSRSRRRTQRVSRPYTHADGRQSDDQPVQLGDILDTGDHQLRYERNATGFHDDMMFRVSLAAKG